MAHDVNDLRQAVSDRTAELRNLSNALATIETEEDWFMVQEQCQSVVSAVVETMQSAVQMTRASIRLLARSSEQVEELKGDRGRLAAYIAYLEQENERLEQAMAREVGYVR